MKFKSQIVTAASGSIGGTTFARNRFGLYQRARATPVNPNTSFQVAVRNLLTQLTSAWSTDLTDAQRGAWDNYAASVTVTDVFGDAINLTGHQHYIRGNVARLQAGLARVDDGPTVLALPTFALPSITASALTDEIQVTFDDTEAWADEDGAGLLIYGSRSTKATINFFDGPYRFADSIDGNSTTPPTSPGPVDSAFTLTEDQKLFARCVLVRADGRASSPIRISAIIGS